MTELVGVRVLRGPYLLDPIWYNEYERMDGTLELRFQYPVDQDEGTETTETHLDRVNKLLMAEYVCGLECIDWRDDFTCWILTGFSSRFEDFLERIGGIRQWYEDGVSVGYYSRSTEYQLSSAYETMALELLEGF